MVDEPYPTDLTDEEWALIEPLLHALPSDQQPWLKLQPKLLSLQFNALSYAFRVNGLI
jgi:hypothetical protein